MYLLSWCGICSIAVLVIFAFVDNDVVLLCDCLPIGPSLKRMKHVYSPEIALIAL